MSKRKSRKTVKVEAEPTSPEPLVVSTENVSEELPREEPVFGAEPVAEPDEPETVKEKPKKTELVKVQVVIGSLTWEGGTYQKGEIFEVSPERLKLFDPKDIKVL